MDSNLLMSGKTQYAAPTPADATAAPLSMTSGGRVRTDVTGTVAVSGTTTVSVTGTPAVTATITGTPAVSISGTPAVTATITGTPAVSISGTPAVTISGTPTVTSTGTPTNGTAYSATTAASTNGANIKASAGNLFEVSVFNSTAATIYVRLYNKASSPTVGTDIPVAVIPVATNAFASAQFGHLGKRFSTGIAISVTGGATNTDSTNVAAGALVSATYL